MNVFTTTQATRNDTTNPTAMVRPASSVSTSRFE
jgi:hypothetical protein